MCSSHNNLNKMNKIIIMMMMEIYKIFKMMNMENKNKMMNNLKKQMNILCCSKIKFQI